MNRICQTLMLFLGLMLFCGTGLLAQQDNHFLNFRDIELNRIVPKPKQTTLVTIGDGFRIGEEFSVVVADRPHWKDHLEVIVVCLERVGSTRVSVATMDGQSDTQGCSMVVAYNADLADEAYRLQVSESQIRIEAKTLKGLAHATSSLVQLVGAREDGTIPRLDIQDEPTCSYRSFMVDLGRNAHSIECLEETIDLLWFYKIDSLQLHLTDDQRFAFPTKAFPKLVTQKGRISWDEFAALEKYAQIRGVTLIPELEVPGHSTILRREYPEVFGKSTTDLAKSGTALAAIKTMIDELIELFPSSPYIHIGGDEAYGVPEDLQRDLINKLHAYLKSKGKKTLVWEGPVLGKGDNKVNAEVIHINWRTINFPADKMLDAGYRVVNAAWDPLYIVDHYPRNNFTMVSPQYIYEQMDLLKFKHFNPQIKTFAKPVTVKPNDRLLGFCMPWWEGREENYFPMIVPRLIPMGAIAWNNEVNRDYEKFARNVIQAETTRRSALYPTQIDASPIVLKTEGVFYGTTEVSLPASEIGEVRYTLDGSPPSTESALYKQKVKLDRSAIVRSALFVDGQQVGHGTRRTLVKVDPIENLALGKSVVSNVTEGPLFSLARLTDGGTGNLDYFLGYPAEPQPVQITVDLGEATAFNRVTLHTFFNGRAYESYEVQVSDDGEVFETVAKRYEKPEKAAAKVAHDFETRNARYVRVITRGCKENVFDSFSRITEIQVFNK